MIDVVTRLYSFKTPTGNIRSTILVNYICIIVITMFINEFVNYILDSYIWYILGCSISKYDLQWSYCGLSPAHPPPPQPDCLLTFLTLIVCPLSSIYIDMYVCL